MDQESYEQERYKQLGFKPQKEIIYSKFLPYADKLDEESLKLYTDIKTNLVKAILLREIRPGCVLWMSRLNKYIKVYGMKFSKEDHIAWIKLLFDLITIPDLEPTRVNKFASTLTLLLKKKELISPGELELPWRPLYDLCMRIMNSSQSSIGMYKYFSTLDNNLDFLVHAARFYFPASATQEMLDEWRPKLCPFDTGSMASTMELMERFLPIALPPEVGAVSGHGLWLNELLALWEVCHNAPPWEGDLMWLLARLAMYNIGQVDWEPHIPLMFTRFLRTLDLPVSFRQKQSPKHHKLDITPIAMWIVSVSGGGSSALHYLAKMMQAVESYYHPANSGRWACRLRDLLKKLPFYFVQRLHRERYKKPSWETRVPDSHRLTEQDIDRFVQIMRPVVVQAIYSRQGTSEVSSALQHLATLRPQVMVPLVLDKLYSTLDSLTEPHKLTAAMQCLVAVARPMLQGPHAGYPEGPTHVIPLLLSLLPGIDTNDIRKCLLTFQFISTFVSMIPLFDSSNMAWEGLTEEQHNIVESTAAFEDFVLQFFDRVFMLVQSSSLEMTRLEQLDFDKKSKLESMAESALSSICTVIATQSSQKIFKSALRKLYSFVTQHILETKVSGRMVAIIIRSFIRVQPEDTLKLFVPYITERILELLGDNEEIQQEERLDTELLYLLLLVSEMIDCQGRALVPYVPALKRILDNTLHLKSTQGCSMANRLLNNILVSLTVIQPIEYRSSPPPFYEDLQRLPILDWGAPGDIHNLQISWYEPSHTEISVAQELVEEYLMPELRLLEEWQAGRQALSREELRQKLAIILACLGAQSALPMWDEPADVCVPSRLQPWVFEMVVGPPLFITMPDGSNVRKTIADLMHNLQKKMLQDTEDDIKSLFNLISIWDALLMNRFRGRDFESHWKYFHMIKRLLADCLRGGKRHQRQVLIDRVLLHQELRTESRSFTFTRTHRRVLHDLYQLSVSHYSEVRVRAQKKLFLAISSFPYSYTVLTPLLKRSLHQDTKLHHEEFKGCLHILLGPKSTPLVARHDWGFVKDIWPSLVTSMPSEKPSVINLMSAIVDSVHKFFPTISVDVEIPEVCLEAAERLAHNAPTFPLTLTPQQRQEGVLELTRISERNRNIYMEIQDMLHTAMTTGNLHWRYHTMALSFVRDLVHPNVKYSDKMVKYVLSCLIHDTLMTRKMAIFIMVYILKQHKPEHKKLEVDPLSYCGGGGAVGGGGGGPGPRPDNQWVQYESSRRPQSAEAWDEPRYLHKQYHGFYSWPRSVQVYAPASHQPPLGRPFHQLSPQEQHIHHFFSNQSNVDTLIKYLSMEEKKGRDKFNGYRFIMFKNLFRNHGDRYVGLFLGHVRRLVLEKEEQSQRCAAEVVAGLVRGAKHWPYAQVEALWAQLTPLLRLALANMTVETISDWGICFATATENRDPNRNHFLYELLMEEPLREEASFIECGRMYTLQGALNQQVWRVSELTQRLFRYLQPYLTHPFQNVRERVSSVLANVFETDLQFPGGAPTRGPRIQAFIDEVMPRLQVLYESGLKDVRHRNHTTTSAVDHTVHMLEKVQIDEAGKENAIRLFKTVSKWVIGSISRSNFACTASFYKLFPLACLLQSYEADEELTYICSSLLALLGQSLTLAHVVPHALAAVAAVADTASWSARAACAEFIQVLVFHNMAVLLSNQHWVQQIREIVLRLLEDENPEVRAQAGQLLGGLLHCQFIQEPDQLLEIFKQKAKTKLNKVKHKNSESTNCTTKNSNLRVRHCGVLGMCAFINAYPYEVPDFLPDVFLQLGKHLNDPQPIPTSIRKTLGDFKRTHHDNWEVHQLKFSESQLSVLSDLTVPPSYYA